MRIIFRLHLIFIVDLQHVRHLSLRQIHSSDVTDSWGGSSGLLYYVLNAKFRGASEQSALFRQQTNILVRGSENNAIYFSFLLAIFHSYVMCVLQRLAQPGGRKQQPALIWCSQGQGTMAVYQVTVDLLNALVPQVCSKTRGAGECKPIKQSHE